MHYEPLETLELSTFFRTQTYFGESEILLFRGELVSVTYRNPSISTFLPAIWKQLNFVMLNQLYFRVPD
ncbi:hypothetical protein RB195_018114 [Necator americanus]|uniref:Uncharacterized protein n=1 Tax=Necator americanus TaxID=51031 RepID=A0ABR1C896_NECAM